MHPIARCCTASALACLLFAPPLPAATTGPAFDCSKAEPGSIEALICADAGLAALDRQLDAAYRRATEIAANQQPPTLKAEQRGWIKGRNDCWKAKDIGACVSAAYRYRIAELQARYRLVEFRGPQRYACAGNPANELVLTWFSTDPPSAIAERGDAVSFMLRDAVDEALLVGRNERVHIGSDELRLQWGFEAAELVCLPATSERQD